MTSVRDLPRMTPAQAATYAAVLKDVLNRAPDPALDDAPAEAPVVLPYTEADLIDAASTNPLNLVPLGPTDEDLADYREWCEEYEQAMFERWVAENEPPDCPDVEYPLW